MIKPGVYLIPITGSVSTCLFNKHVRQILVGLASILTVLNTVHADYTENKSSLTCIQSVNLSVPLDGVTTLVPGTFVLGIDPTGFIVDIEGPLGNQITCAQVGDVLKVVVTDPNTDNSCWSYLKVEDKLPPWFTLCEDVTIFCNQEIEDWPGDHFYEVEDNCNTEGQLHIWYTDEIISMDCPEDAIKEIERTWIAEDKSGNSSDCVQIISVERFELEDVDFPPDITVYCPDDLVDPESLGYPTHEGELLDPLCEIIVFHQDTELPFGCDGNGKIMRMWSAMDWCSGETEESLQIIIIQDTIPPVIECPPDATIGTVDLVCNGAFAIPEIEVSDECAEHDESIQVKVIVDGLPYYLEGDIVKLDTGHHEIQYVATDPCGNSDTCLQMIWIMDTTPPMIDCGPDSLIIAQIPLMNNDSVTVPAHAFHFYMFDNCDLGELSIRKILPSCGIEGETEFGEDVTFCCADIPDSVQLEVQILDLLGNADSCQFWVDIKEPSEPVVMCLDTTIYIGSDGLAIATLDMVVDTAYDHCGLPLETIFLVQDTFDCDDIGIQMIDLIAIDLDGNSDTCITNITVLDTLQPECEVMELTVYFDENGYAIITEDSINVEDIASDNCGLLGFEVDPDTLLCDMVGINPSIEFLVSDVNGNFPANCTINVTALDTLPPICDVTDLTVYFDENGYAIITEDSINVEDIASDNCGLLGFEVDPDTLICDIVGMNPGIEFLVSDVNGNFPANCTINVTALDTLPPICDVTELTVYFDENGYAIITEDSINVEDIASDNCGLLGFEVDPDTLFCDMVGLNPDIEFLVSDVNGNFPSNCTINVTALDTLPPVCDVTDFTVYFDEDGYAIITEDSINVEDIASDNCGLLGFDPDPDTLFCGDIGLNPDIKFLVSDVNGNFPSNCTINVTALDTIPPVIMTCFADTTINCIMNDATELSDFGDPADVFSSAADNCGIDSTQIDTIVLNENLIDLQDTIIRRFIVYDEAGLSDTCIQEIIVIPEYPCPLPFEGEVDVSGLIFMDDKHMIPNVELTGTGAEIMYATTDQEGKYTFRQAAMEEEFVVTATRVDDWYNGITINDVILLHEHILGMNALKSPYLQIAGDVDQSRDLSVFDVLELHKLVLGIQISLPAGEPWKFVPASFRFTDQKYPLRDLIPNEIVIDSRTNDFENQNFIGIKIGDLDMDADLHKNADAVMNEISIRLIRKDFDVSMYDNVILEALPEGMKSSQLSIQLDPSVRVKGYTVIDGSELSNIKTHYFRRQNRLNIIAYNLIGEMNPKLKLQLSLRKPGEMDELLKLAEDYSSRIFSHEGIPFEAVLDFEAEYSQLVPGIQIKPNPFTDQTNIRMTGFREAVDALEIYNSLGMLIKKIPINREVRDEEIILDRQHFSGNGLYILQVVSGEYRIGKKLVLN